MVREKEPVGLLPGTQDARLRLVAWQAATLTGCAMAALWTAVARPNLLALILVVTWIGTSWFVNLYRLWLGWQSARALRSGDARAPVVRPLDDSELPSYTILLPLCREARIVPQLIAGLRALDYPSDQLQFLCLLRGDDHETREALQALELPPNFRILIQPPDLPVGTKPAACNFALAQATGELLVIFDAEDVPEPQQLRKAAATLAQGPPDLACVETPRTVYNAGSSFMTRLYEMESLAWHRLLLPGLLSRERLGPLHGSGCHFRTAFLREIGAWDYYNVTEDCDLGTRIYRRGFRMALLDSVTGEEAPPNVGDWIRQRTRWNKGFLQTFFIHSRNPAALLRSLGVRGSLAFTTLLGLAQFNFLLGFPAWVVSLFWWVVALTTGKNVLGPREAALAQAVLNSGAALMLLAIALNVAAVVEARAWRTLPFAFVTPIHWLLLTAAAYRAAWQFFVAPFGWEKTPHGHTIPSTVQAPVSLPD